MTAPMLLTEAEAAHALRLCTRTLRKARKDGRLQFVLIGRAVRYRTDDLSAFIETHAMAQAPAPKPRPQMRRASGIAGRTDNIVPFSQR